MYNICKYVPDCTYNVYVLTLINTNFENMCIRKTQFLLRITWTIMMTRCIHQHGPDRNCWQTTKLRNYDVLVIQPCDSIKNRIMARDLVEVDRGQSRLRIAWIDNVLNRTGFVYAGLLCIQVTWPKTLGNEGPLMKPTVTKTMAMWHDIIY